MLLKMTLLDTDGFDLDKEEKKKRRMSRYAKNTNVPFPAIAMATRLAHMLIMSLIK